MQIKTNALRKNLPDLLLFVEQACHRYQISRQTRLNLQLAVEETCVNIIEHGYAGWPPGTIEIIFQRRDHQVSITVVDFGRKFDPTTHPPPDTSSEWDQRPVGGLGVFLITKLMDEVHYTSDPEQGNRLELIKNIE
jgi:anti-sigma regulatory factor (Ser/Thr protein kinase)